MATAVQPLFGTAVRPLSGLLDFTVGRRVAAELVEHLVHLLEFAAQVVAGGDLADGEPQRGQFAGEVLGVGLGLLGAAPVLLQRDPVAVLLPVLRQQDQRRRVGRLGGERQVEQDERVRIPAQADARTRFSAIQTITMIVWMAR